MKIVIAGCDAAGLETALMLKKKVKDAAKLIVVNENQYYEFRPSHKDSRIDLSALFSKKGIDFVKGKVVALDHTNKTVTFKNSKEKYDFLVLALGTVPNIGIPGKDNAIAYNDTTDLKRIHAHFKQVLGSSVDKKQQNKDKALTIVVIGGGTTGVQLVCQVNEFLDKCCSEQGVRRIDIKLVLLEAYTDVLPAFPSNAREFVSEHLSRQGIDVRTGMEVREIKKNALVLKDGSVIEAGTMIWCGGNKPHPLAKNANIKTAENGGVVVNRYMQSTGDATIYAAGGLASIKGLRKTFDSESLGAHIRQAKIAANNIASNVKEGTKKDYKYKNSWVFLDLGKTAMMVRGNTVLKGKYVKIIKFIREWFYLSGRH
ncbi:NAD(P)/FAD-dependent oxidoreductase [Nanoarchaeota archaeon]